MSFSTDIKDLHSIMPDIVSLSSKLTPDLISSIKKLNQIDFGKVNAIVKSYEQLVLNGKDITLVSRGLSDIKSVVNIQNQVKYVSDIRESIGLVAGNTKDIKALAEDLTYVRASTLMEPMIKEVLDLSTKMDLVLDMEESINRFINESDLADEKIARMNDLAIQASNSAKLAVDMVNKSNAIEKRIDAKLKRVEELADNLTNLTIEYVSVPHTEPAKMSYVDNELVLYIPAGKPGPKGKNPGEKGEPGNNGKNFEAMYKGRKHNMAKYGAYPTGTSFLSLDESEPMIYFRKSNATDDWTEGQPFGVVNVENAERLAGYTLDEIFSIIRTNVKGEINAAIST